MDFGLYNLNLNFTAIQAFFAQSSSEIVLGLLAIFGWLVLVYLLIYAGLHLTVEYRQGLYTKNWKWVLLAVDVPQLNVQTPMAVEQMFNHLSGAFNDPSIAEKYREGFKQRWFSFEVISIEGYIQFLIRTEETFRDLVEASIYAQYPDAEVVEVEDYVDSVPARFPNEEYDVWAADFGLEQHWSYPLRTYEEFEHKISKDTVLKDPMGTFLESFSRLGPGEQMWFQIIVEPISNKWKEEVIKKIESITGGKSVEGKTLADKLADLPLKSLEFIGDQVFNRPDADGDDATKADAKKELAPGQSKLLEGMINKIQKIGFKTKMRGIYVARKEVFHPERGVNAMVGAVSQFNIPNANSLLPVFKSGSPSYLFKEKRIIYRKNLLFNAYKKRKIKVGGNPFVLNIMELASIWHFPMSHVKTPLLQKASAKAAEPPAGLPVEIISNTVNIPTPENTDVKSEQTKKYHTDSGDITDDDEIRFG